ncbi:osmoprotectant transport system substrate-binding protein [Brevibacterium sanguinis]|uniref:Osmoprotectant transport system substrate-binding protein n=2 Tax=Brevibacterium TaxID=1696 RepID=A0A366IL36_9MICO|nr:MULTISPECIES: ABC transporter substrate-binding protein [Brevibacterium]RBP64240.1 osmoprotectant transport system substrate-binding protein [Brevibacterium sanguinis]RBP71468.1 osmoprotectant transport system substrate-binding protein [Brevibacterium celere]
MIRSPRTALAATAACALLLSGCGGDPLEDQGGQSADTDAIVIGSQDYYSNEIIAETYAQALEAAGETVDRQFRIGQREVYLPEIENGSIDLFPEYSGPLLQYWDAETPARKSDEVHDALVQAMPEGLRALDQARATDQDSYVVTREFAEEWDLSSIEDLAKVDEPMTMGANSEAENRPNGPRGLKEVYGVDVDFAPIEDGGGPLTVKALTDDDVQLAIIYTADPSIRKNDLVSLEDPKGLFLASHVVPVASDAIDDSAAEVVDRVNAALTTEVLMELNARSVEEELPAADIAGDWLSDAGLR